MTLYAHSKCSDGLKNLIKQYYGKDSIEIIFSKDRRRLYGVELSNSSLVNPELFSELEKAVELNPDLESYIDRLGNYVTFIQVETENSKYEEEMANK